MNNTKKGDEIQMPYQLLDKEIQCGMTYKSIVFSHKNEVWIYGVVMCDR